MDVIAKRKTLVVMARCSSKGLLLGITFKLKGENLWVSDWAFEIPQKVNTEREGYCSENVNGAFNLSDQYPGCPFCCSKSLFKCHCGKLNCHRNDASEVRCAWCQATGVPSGLVNSLSMGSDI